MFVVDYNGTSDNDINSIIYSMFLSFPFFRKKGMIEDRRKSRVRARFVRVRASIDELREIQKEIPDL